MGISTHILDTAQGCPAAGIEVSLAYHQENGDWLDLGTGPTNEDGRIASLLPNSFALKPGMYRISFATSHYFAFSGMNGFYPVVTIVFEVTDPAQHYHVPLLLSPYGYSTYRGS